MFLWTPVYGELNLQAALDEMRFWVQIMDEHARFIRSGLDPSEESSIQIASDFIIIFNCLLQEVRGTIAPQGSRINHLVNISITETRALRDFKMELKQLIERCRVIAELPAGLFDHIRREADYFLAVLHYLTGYPVPRREILGIPDGNQPAAILPKLLIPETKNRAVEVARDEHLFWLRIHMEHGEVLLLIAYRPEVQRELYAKTQEFEQALERLWNEAKTLPQTREAYLNFGNKIRPEIVSWRNFLLDLYNRVHRCEVPTGQINTSVLILDHMAREAGYHLEVIDNLARALA